MRGRRPRWDPRPIAARLGCGDADLVSLFRRVVVINAGVLASAAILLAVSPATVSPSLQLAEAVVLAIGTVLMISVNLVLMRRVFGPLEQLTSVMRRVDPQSPGKRLRLERADAEVADLRDSFNAMLDRLEAERLHSGRRALAAQEAERRRLARELHDEIGQALTGVVLQLEALQRRAPEALQAAIVEAQQTARDGVEDMREIARGLRPQALDEFGLRSALVSLTSQVSDRAGLIVRPRLAEHLPPLTPEHELAIYRVAQESLTNAARHADARHVDLSLDVVDGSDVELRVRDDGRGITPEQAIGGSGLAGMRERALLVGGQLAIANIRPGGTEVTLRVSAGGGR
jgi:two-component system sensor histidine kinase UhpB